MNATRHNAGKPDLSLIPWDAEEEEAYVWMGGEDEYGRHNWEKLWGESTIDVVLASLLRHANALKRGEYFDGKSGRQHAAHIRCNAAMIIRHVRNLEEITNEGLTSPEDYDMIEKYNKAKKDYYESCNEINKFVNTIPDDDPVMPDPT